MHKRIWQIHSWLGLVCGLGLLVIGVTGSLLVFREELERLFHRDVVELPAPVEQRLSLDQLRSRAEEQLKGYEITGWLVRPETQRHLADAIWVVPHGSREWQFATIDPSSGKMISAPRENTSAVTGWLLQLHYTFFADHAGMIVTAVFGAALCLLGISGVWLYRDFWRNFFTLRWGRSARILFSDFHKLVGITSTVFNLVLGFTGAYWNFTHVIGEELAGHEEPPPMVNRLYGEDISIDAMLADARAKLAGYEVGYIGFPWQPGGDIILYGSFPDDGPLRSQYGTTVVYDAHSGAHKSTRDIRTADWWSQTTDAFTPLHFGNFGGLPIKIIWSLAGLAPGALAISGSAIWWLRRRRPVRSKYVDGGKPLMTTHAH
jgi:uncharacterized iron-regulated membrane protein